MKLLSLSDRVLESVYSRHAAQRFADVDLVLGCGDLPYYYLEFLIDVLGKPLFFVRGNHAQEVEYSTRGERRGPWGGIDLHRRVVKHNGLLLGGFQGSLRYRRGPFQYSQTDMWLFVLGMTPRLIWNRAVHGRALDVLATHAPAWGLHDQPDLAHQGFKALRWLLTVFQPSYHFHGHVHVYTDTTPVRTQFGRTEIINTFGYQENVLELPGAGKKVVG